MPGPVHFADRSGGPRLRLGRATGLRGAADRVRGRFDKLVGPSGTVHTADGAGNVYRCLRRFCELLAGLAVPPTDPGGLRPRHLDEHALKAGPVTGTVWGEDGILRRSAEPARRGHPEFAARCARPLPRPACLSPPTSYTREEDEQIQQAARAAVRSAARRIRANHELLMLWRAGDKTVTADPHVDDLCRVLDMVEQTGTVPRRPSGTVQSWARRHGNVTTLMSTLHLRMAESSAFATLLIRLTGQNLGTIRGLPVVHHRADGYTGARATALVDLDKPRRGHRRHMTVALTDLPTWLRPADPRVAADGYDELHSAFGLYMLLLELSGPARRITGVATPFVNWEPRRARSVVGS